MTSIRPDVAGLALAVIACAGCSEPAAPVIVDPDAASVVPEDPAPDWTGRVFDTKVLHRVDIRVDPQYFDQLEWYRDERVPCTVTYDGVTLDNVGIRQKRGGGSWSWLGGKPGLSIKFDERVPGQTLHGMRKLVLNNAKQDDGFLNEHMAYEVYRRAGIPAPRTAHAIVTLNGWAYGVYVVKEPINKQFLARAYGAAAKQGNLYEGVCCADFAFNVPLMDLKNEAEDGRLRDDLYDLADVVVAGPDATFVDRAEAVLHVDEFLTYYAIEALVDSPDTYSRNRNNYYLFHHPDGRFRILPHGMDKVFSDALDADNHYEPLAAPRGHLSRRARDVPELDERWRTTLVDLAERVWDTDALLARVDAVADLLHRSPPVDDRVARDIASFDATVELVRSTIMRRKAMTGVLQAVCGDGVLEGPEECDDNGIRSGDGCSSWCFVEHCGDDIWQPGIGEVCDGDGCNLDCTGPSECGNGLVEDDEQCDYGVLDPNDDCTDACEWMWCGDGVVQPQIGEVCEGAGCKRNCAGPATCGDALLDWGEDCDDGNSDPQDGCSDSCRFDDCVIVAANGSQVAVCPTPRPFLAAEQTCLDEDRFLATPVSADETAWLAGQILAHGGTSAWLGAARDGSGLWRDAQGDELAFTAWAPGHPSSAATSSCALLDAHTGLWSSVDCAMARVGAVCHSAKAVTTPQTRRPGGRGRGSIPPAAQAARRRTPR